MLRFPVMLGIACLAATHAGAQPAEQIFRHASLDEICGKLVTENVPACLGKKAQYDQQYGSCVQYGFDALRVFTLKGDGRPENVATEVMTPRASGLNGLTLMEHLIVAAYHGDYGNTSTEFSGHAFTICMKGEPF